MNPGSQETVRVICILPGGEVLDVLRESVPANLVPRPGEILHFVASPPRTYAGLYRVHYIVRRFELQFGLESVHINCYISKFPAAVSEVSHWNLWQVRES